MATPEWKIDDYDGVIAPYVTGAAKTCSYCDQLQPLILLEGPHTTVNLAIGHMVPGYVQVCSRSHTVSSAELRSDAAEEFDFIADIIRRTFERVYGTLGIAFEHGKAGACLWRKGDLEALRDLCHHAHVHFVPLNVDLLPRIASGIKTYLRIEKWRDLGVLRQDVLTSGAYLYYDDVRSAYVFPVASTHNLRPQFLRTCLAEALGRPEIADWRAYTGTELFAETRGTLLAPLCAELCASGARVTQPDGRPVRWIR